MAKKTKILIVTLLGLVLLIAVVMHFGKVIGVDGANPIERLQNSFTALGNKIAEIFSSILGRR